jgi:hypothetical protein
MTKAEAICFAVLMFAIGASFGSIFPEFTQRLLSH